MTVMNKYSELSRPELMFQAGLTNLTAELENRFIHAIHAFIITSAWMA